MVYLKGIQRWDLIRWPPSKRSFSMSASITKNWPMSLVPIPHRGFPLWIIILILVSMSCTKTVAEPILRPMEVRSIFMLLPNRPLCSIKISRSSLSGSLILSKTVIIAILFFARKTVDLLHVIYTQTTLHKEEELA